MHVLQYYPFWISTELRNNYQLLSNCRKQCKIHVYSYLKEAPALRKFRFPGNHEMCRKQLHSANIRGGTVLTR